MEAFSQNFLVLSVTVVVLSASFLFFKYKNINLPKTDSQELNKHVELEPPNEIDVLNSEKNEEKTELKQDHESPDKKEDIISEITEETKEIKEKINESTNKESKEKPKEPKEKVNENINVDPKIDVKTEPEKKIAPQGLGLIPNLPKQNPQQITKKNVRYGKQALIAWSNHILQKHDKSIEIRNLDRAWANSRVWGALIFEYYPDKIDFHGLPKDDHPTNIRTIWKIAETVGINLFLSADDLISLGLRPDTQSTTVQVAEFYFGLNNCTNIQRRQGIGSIEYSWD